MDRTRFQWLVGFVLLWIVVWSLAFHFDLHPHQTEDLSTTDDNKKKFDYFLKRKPPDSGDVLNTAAFQQLVSLLVKTETESVGIQTFTPCSFFRNL